MYVHYAVLIVYIVLILIHAHNVNHHIIFYLLIRNVMLYVLMVGMRIFQQNHAYYVQLVVKHVIQI